MRFTAAELDAAGVAAMADGDEVAIEPSPEADAVLVAAVTPSFMNLPPGHHCSHMWSEMLTVLVMGISIGAHAQKARS